MDRLTLQCALVALLACVQHSSCHGDLARLKGIHLPGTENSDFRLNMPEQHINLALQCRQHLPRTFQSQFLPLLIVSLHQISVK